MTYVVTTMQYLRGNRSDVSDHFQERKRDACMSDLLRKHSRSFYSSPSEKHDLSCS